MSNEQQAPKPSRADFLKLLRSAAPIQKPVIAKPKVKKQPKPIDDIQWKNKKVIFTGGITDMTREIAEGYLTKMGASMGSAISRNTDYLVVGSDNVSDTKVAKAKKLGVTIVNEAQWMAALKHHKLV